MIDKGTIIFVELALFSNEEKNAFDQIFTALIVKGQKVLQIHYAEEAVIKKFDYLIFPHYLFQASINKNYGNNPDWFNKEDKEWYIKFDKVISKNRQNKDKYHSLKSLTRNVDLLICNTGPSLVITHNTIGHLSVLFRKAAKHYECQSIVIERAPFYGYYLLEKESIWYSSILRDINLDDISSRLYPKKIVELVKSESLVLSENTAAYRSNKRINVNIKKDNKLNVLFLPEAIELSGWGLEYKYLLKNDYGNINNFRSVLKEIVNATNKNNGKLYIKPHPECRYFPNKEPFGYNLIKKEGNLDEIFGIADIVICGNSKTAYAAYVRKIPVISIVKNPSTALGISYYSPYELLAKSISSVITSGHIDRDNSLCYLFAEYYYKVIGIKESDRGIPEFTRDILKNVHANKLSIAKNYDYEKLQCIMKKEWDYTAVFKVKRTFAVRIKQKLKQLFHTKQIHSFLFI